MLPEKVEMVLAELFGWYWAHQAGGVRLVANQVQQRVKNAVAAAKGVSDPAERSQAVSAAWTTTPEAVMPTQRTEAEREQGGASGRRWPVCSPR